jgi:hypothetical protein
MAPRRSLQHKRNAAFWLKAVYNVVCVVCSRNSYPIFQPLWLIWPIIICENFDIGSPPPPLPDTTHTHTHWLLTICDVSQFPEYILVTADVICFNHAMFTNQ